VSSTHCSEPEQAFLDRVGQISQRDSRLQRQAPRSSRPPPTRQR
jgi:hypothetical protein